MTRRAPLPTLALVVALCACVGPKRQQRAQARVELGTAYLGENKPEAAIEALREAVGLDPRNWRGWQSLGLAYMARGATDESERAFKRALGLVPEEAEVNNNYGLMLLNANRTSEAIARFEVARQDLEYRKPAWVLSNLGYALYLNGEYDRAIGALDEAVTRAPNLCQARFHRGLARSARGEHEPALGDFEDLIRLCADEVPGAYVHAAKELCALGRTEEGRAYLGDIASRAAGTEFATQAATVLATACASPAAGATP